MIRRRLLLAALAGVCVLPTACLRSSKNASGLLASLKQDKVPAPQPPLPTTVSGDKSSPAVVQPPSFDPKNPVPALPGMPGTASQPTTDPDAKLISADDGDRKGLFERLRDRREERQKEKPLTLPPAVEPKVPDGLPVRDRVPEPPRTVPDSPPPIEAKRPEPKVEPKPEPPKSDLAGVREVIDTASKKNADTPSFEAKLVKREVVNGKQLPAEEAIYQFRKDPLSVHIRVVGDAGNGREVLWVKGKNNDQMTVVSGKGDTILGSGIKLTVDPDDKRATEKSRYKIYEAGMSRPIGALTKFVEQAEKGKRPADTVKLLGAVERKEYKQKLNAVEVTLNSSDDPYLPKGGKRLYHFDADPKSPSRGLPVLVISLDHTGAEVEYYCFTDFTLLGELTDADFDVNKVGKKK